MEYKQLFLFWLLCFCVHCEANAHQPDSVLITSFTNLGDVGWFEQFTFVHKKPVNKVDSWVQKVRPFGKYDYRQMVGFIDELGAIRSKESYALLFFMCFQPMIIKHITAYNSLAGSIGHFGGYKVMNKYYLNNAVSTKLSAKDFEKEVRQRCGKNPPLGYYIRK